MAFKTVALFLLVVSVTLACADEPQASSEPTVKELLAKIVQLEQRITELETLLTAPAVYQSVTQYPAVQPEVGEQPSSAYDATHPPTRNLSALPAGSDKPTRRLLEAKVLAPRTKNAPRVPSENVPSSWRRHEFNGSYYYTIPLGGSKAQH